jgi:hypothetical protein
MLPKHNGGGYGIRPYKIKIGHIILGFSYVMCPIFIYYKKLFYSTVFCALYFFGVIPVSRLNARVK